MKSETKSHLPAPQKINLFKIGLILVSILATAGLALMIYAGTFSRFIADDFCYYNVFRNYGFFNGILYYYNTWSGRFSALILIGLTKPFGTQISSWMPGISIVIFLAVLTGLVRLFTRFFGIKFPTLSAYSFAASMLLLILTSTPNIFQSTFWLNGQATYTWSLIFLSLVYIWFFDHLLNHKTLSVAGAISGVLLSLFSAGFSETTASIQCAMVILTVGALLLFQPKEFRKKSLAIMAAMIAGTFIGTVILMAAPGNLVRQAMLPDRPGLIELAMVTLPYPLRLLHRFLADRLIYLILIFGCGLLFAFLSEERHIIFPSSSRQNSIRKYLLLAFSLVIFIYITLMAFGLPSLYASSRYPIDRTLISGTMILFTGVFCLAVLTGAMFRSIFTDFLNRQSRLLNGTMIALLACFSGFIIWISVQFFPILNHLQMYSGQWDQRATRIEQSITAGETDLLVEKIDNLYDIEEITSDPSYWVNECAAEFYAVDSITAE